MARNRKVTVIGNDQVIAIEDGSYTTCIVRKINAPLSGEILIEYESENGTWQRFIGGSIISSSGLPVSARVQGKPVNRVRVSTTGMQPGDVTAIEFFFTDDESFIFDGLLTSPGNTNTARVKTDNQPTSFENNQQFRIFHRFIGVPNNTQMVFKFAVTNPVNIQDRKINLWSGGREYLVVPDDGSYGEVDAVLTTPVQVRTVNNNRRDSGLPSHPVSGVTVTYGTGTGLFTIGPTDQFPNGDAVLSDATGNKGNSNLLQSPNLSGVGENQTFYLVFLGINGNTGTSGHFLVQWEELF